MINTDHVTAAERAVSVLHTDCTALFFSLQSPSFPGGFLVELFVFSCSLFVYIFKRILILGGPFSFPPSSGTFPESITIFICLFGYASLCESTYTLGGRTGYAIFFT